VTPKQAFQEAVRSVVARGEYPGPLAITRERDRLFHEGLSHRNSLGSVEMGWRAEVLIELGWAPTHEKWPRRKLRSWNRPKDHA
jgi:hypothetical protein